MAYLGRFQFSNSYRSRKGFIDKIESKTSRLGGEKFLERGINPRYKNTRPPTADRRPPSLTINCPYLVFVHIAIAV
jgi:hypothetical protein